MAIKTYPTDSNAALTANFRVSEFKCKCAAKHEILIDEALVTGLQRLREIVRQPLHINSGHRCEDHNRNEGGVSNSPHIGGYGSDLALPAGVTALDLAALAWNAGFRNIGVSKTFVHLDSRPARKEKPSRFWTYPGVTTTEAQVRDRARVLAG